MISQSPPEALTQLIQPSMSDKMHTTVPRFAEPRPQHLKRSGKVKNFKSLIENEGQPDLSTSLAKRLETGEPHESNFHTQQSIQTKACIKPIQKSFSDPLWQTARTITSISEYCLSIRTPTPLKDQPQNVKSNSLKKTSPRKHLSSRLEKKGPRGIASPQQAKSLTELEGEPKPLSFKEKRRTINFSPQKSEPAAKEASIVQKRPRSATFSVMANPIFGKETDGQALEPKKKVSFDLSECSSSKPSRKLRSPRASQIRQKNDFIPPPISLHLDPIRAAHFVSALEKNHPQNKTLSMIYCVLMKKNPDGFFARKTLLALTIEGQDNLFWTSAPKTQTSQAIEFILNSINCSLLHGFDTFSFTLFPGAPDDEKITPNVLDLINYLLENHACKTAVEKSPHIQKKMIALTWDAFFTKPKRDAEGILTIIDHWEEYMSPIIKNLSTIQEEILTSLKARYAACGRLSNLKACEINQIIKELGWKDISGSCNIHEVVKALESVFAEPSKIWVYDKRCLVTVDTILKRAKSVVPNYLEKIGLLKEDLFHYISADREITDDDRKSAMSYYRNCEYGLCMYAALKKQNLAYTNTFENFTSATRGICSLMQKALEWKMLNNPYSEKCLAEIKASFEEPIDWNALGIALQLFASSVKTAVANPPKKLS